MLLSSCRGVLEPRPCGQPPAIPPDPAQYSGTAHQTYRVPSKIAGLRQAFCHKYPVTSTPGNKGSAHSTHQWGALAVTLDCRLFLKHSIQFSEKSKAKLIFPLPPFLPDTVLELDFRTVFIAEAFYSFIFQDRLHSEGGGATEGFESDLPSLRNVSKGSYGVPHRTAHLSSNCLSSIHIHPKQDSRMHNSVHNVMSDVV